MKKKDEEKKVEEKKEEEQEKKKQEEEEEGLKKKARGKDHMELHQTYRSGLTNKQRNFLLPRLTD